MTHIPEMITDPAKIPDVFQSLMGNASIQRAVASAVALMGPEDDPEIRVYVALEGTEPGKLAPVGIAWTPEAARSVAESMLRIVNFKKT